MTFHRRAAALLMVVMLGCSGQPGDPVTTQPLQRSVADPPVFTGLQPGWTKLPPPPEVRSSTAAIVWTGERLVVWGGSVYTGYSDEVSQSNGFTFDARTRRWASMAPSPLGPRMVPAAVWTGDEVLIWGGLSDNGDFLDDGAAYDPESDTWRALPQAPISARTPMFVWTGRELVVWGTAVRMDEPFRDGAAYDPSMNSWRTIATAPVELTDATAVWTGEEMIVFGAELHGGNFPESRTAIGAAYDPMRDIWRELPVSELSPQASTAAWNGHEMIAWDYNHGTAAYSPLTDRWRRLPTVPLDDGECDPISVPVKPRVLGNKCGLMALFDPATDRWRDISRPALSGWGFQLVAADPVVLLLGREVRSGEERMLAYRPPSK